MLTFFLFFSDARLQYYSFFNLDLNGLEGIVRNSSISWKSFLHDPFFLFSRCVTFFPFFFSDAHSSFLRHSLFNLDFSGFLEESGITKLVLDKLKIISSRSSFSLFQMRNTFPFFFSDTRLQHSFFKTRLNIWPGREWNRSKLALDEVENHFFASLFFNAFSTFSLFSSRATPYRKEKGKGGEEGQAVGWAAG